MEVLSAGFRVIVVGFSCLWHHGSSYRNQPVSPALADSNHLTTRKSCIILLWFALQKLDCEAATVRTVGAEGIFLCSLLSGALAGIGIFLHVVWGRLLWSSRLFSGCRESLASQISLSVKQLCVWLI